ncbi:MAG: NUDIX domain-containing protein [Alphaproteobacteria bacterium]|nr:NUDIX domain-containing protein [Alphaproteobacteria bacterium]
MDEIQRVDLSTADLKSYKKKLADCVVLTHEGKLYLQRRPENWGSHAGVINLFGGHVEAGETAEQGVIRELNEETGARIAPEDLVFIDAVTEGMTQHAEIVHIYFWQDKAKTITGCHEAEPVTFDTVDAALAHPKIVPYAAGAL